MSGSKSNGYKVIVYTTFPKVLGLDPYHYIQFRVIFRTLGGGVGGYPASEMQLACSTAPADRMASL